MGKKRVKKLILWWIQPGGGGVRDAYRQKTLLPICILQGKKFTREARENKSCFAKFQQKDAYWSTARKSFTFFFCVLRIGSKTSKTCLLLRNGESGRVCAVYEKSIVLYKSKLFFYKKY